MTSPEHFYRHRCASGAMFESVMPKDEIYFTGKSALGVAQKYDSEAVELACLTPQDRAELEIWKVFIQLDYELIRWGVPQ